MADLTFEQFGRKLNAAASQVRNSEAKIVLSGSTAMATAADAAYRSATGDGRLSGTGGSRRGSGKQAPVGAKAKDVRLYGTDYVGLVVPTGAYGLLERPIDPHIIAPFAVAGARSTTRRNAVRKAVRAAGRNGGSAREAAALARIKLNSKGGTALKFADGEIRGGSVLHPGTKGKAVFSRAVRTSGSKINERMLQETTKQMLAGYRGRG